MKNFCYRWLFVLLATAALSCSKEKEHVSEALSIQGLMAQMKAQARQEWDQFRAGGYKMGAEKAGKLLPKGETLDSFELSEDFCRCGYEIISVTLANPAGYPNSLFEFFSDADCDPLNPFLCGYFNGTYSSTGECVTPFPGCVDLLSPPFTGGYLFNCDVPVFSNIPINFIGIAFGDICTHYKAFDTAAIRFKIHCIGEYYADAGCSRPSGAWTIYSSEEFSISLPPGGMFAPIFNLGLGGCGCQPLSPL